MSNLLSAVISLAVVILSCDRCNSRTIIGIKQTDATTTKKINLCGAKLNFTYTDPSTSVRHWEGGELGRFGLTSRLEREHGRVVHVRTADGERHGCTPPVNIPTDGRPWIALVERGLCKFEQKIHAVTKQGNASAVIIYNHKHEEDLILMTMSVKVNNSVSVFVHRVIGERVAALVDAGVNVSMTISVGTIKTYDYRLRSVITDRPQFTPILFMSLSMVGLLICGLVALLVYAVRRAKYMQKKASTHRIFHLQNRSRPMVQESLLSAEVGTRESVDSAIYC